VLEELDDAIYHNELVEDISNELGPFDYGRREDDGIEREVRDTVLFEKGGEEV
jgi:hypothetical protein